LHASHTRIGPDGTVEVSYSSPQLSTLSTVPDAEEDEIQADPSSDASFVDPELSSTQFLRELIDIPLEEIPGFDPYFPNSIGIFENFGPHPSFSLGMTPWRHTLFISTLLL